MERASAMRRSCRTQITKLMNGAREKLADAAEDINEFQVLVERIKKANESLEHANEQLSPLIEVEQLEEENNKILDYQDQVTEILSRLQLRIDQQYSELEEESVKGSVHTSLSRRTNASLQQGKNNVKLPKLELRKFQGELADWTPFWEQFRTTIHENNDLDAIDKFNYLERALIGKAATTISGLTPSESSYISAIELLKHEYGNKQRIIDSQVQKLLAITPVKSRTDAAGLRSLYNATSSITRNLTSLGIDPNEYAMMVKSVILNTMPYSMKIEFHKQHPNDESKVVKIADQINILLDYLKLEVESIEIAQPSAINNIASSVVVHEKEERRVKHNTNNNKRFTASGLLTTARVECVFCKSSNHLSEKCDKNITLAQKKQVLKTNNQCYRCLKNNHRSRFCRSKITCDMCSSRHATTMCDPDYKKTETSSVKTTTGLLTQERQKSHVLLQTAKAYISAKESPSTSSTFVRLILDGGSQLSYIREDVARKLKLKILGKCRLSVMGFGSEKRRKPQLYNKVEVKLTSQYDDQSITLIAIEVPEICFDNFETPNVSHPTIDVLNLADVSIGGMRTAVDGIVLLVGADNYWRVMTGEFIRVTENLTAMNTKFGWTLQGPTGNESTSAMNVTMVSTLHSQACDDECSFELKNFWELETIGINDKKMETNFTEHFIESEIALKDNRFEVSLPWKNESAVESNYAGAFSRMKNLTFKLSKSSRLLEYDKAVRELVESGVAEKVSKNCESEKIFYLPHRPVYREKKTTSKIRVVFDASAHTPNFPSLNELLHAGENLVQDLMNILVNFRVGKIAITADIEKAFLQISLRVRDRDCHRFLWYEEPIADVNSLPPIQEYRMTRVTFGVTSSPFLLAATLKKLFRMQETSFPETADRLSHSFYVDDLVATVDSTEEATRLYEESKNILKSAGMNLRQWHTNNPDFQRHLKENEAEIDVQECPKVLGIYWDTSNDKLCLDLTSIISYVDEIKNCTKRNVLQTIGRIYDPLSILGPFTIKAKILLQRIWKMKIDWDTELPTEFLPEWKKWCSDLKKLSEFTIPRNVVTATGDYKLELHIFCDASSAAYGACVYIRQVSDQLVSSQLLMAKNRVAPVKAADSGELSLPRLELTGALCAARLKDFVVKNMSLKFDNINLWCDSKITLYWIAGQAAKWKSYVYNRVTEIQKLTKDCTWRHCPGKINPADLLTRGVRADELLKSECWLNGPDFLSCAKTDWPNDELCENFDETVVCAAVANDSETRQNVEPIFPIERFQHWEKCVRVTATVMRVFRKNKGSSKSLTAEELIDAELYWIKRAQQTAFREEIESLKKRDTVDKNSSVYKLTPFVDAKGVLRIKSRLQESELPYETANPILLPKRSLIVEKIIWKTHNRCFHSGTNLTLAEIRKRFWILQARQTIKSLLSKCIVCKKLRGKPGQQVFAPLPRSRISASRPFENTGVDFAGPMYVIENGQKKKTYLMLFTCAAIRAVHLELVLDLSTESCIKGIRRFIGRRGAPTAFHSDNAKTFKRATFELDKLYRNLRSKEVADLFSTLRIQWRFIVERAAWWGGFWERLIKIVKDALKFSLGKSIVNVDELQTILVEIEATVNSRPLTYIDDDKDNLSILTPSSFLLGNQRQCLLPIVNINNRETVIERWRERQRIVTKFWKKWSTEYLQQLRNAHVNTWYAPGQSFRIGDVALLYDQNAPRLSWKMVRVTEVFQGRDGRIRACEVQLSTGVRLRRSVQHLFPLEIPEEIPRPAPEDVENTRHL